MRFHTFALLASLAALTPVRAAAQSARWDPPGGSLAVGETTNLQLVFDGCDPKSTPVPPAVDGLTFEYAGKSSNVSWVNGDFSKSVTLTYAVLLNKKQAVEIPSFAVDTDKGEVRVPAARFGAGAATVGGTGQSLESAADSRLEANPEGVWAGEVFNLDYTVEASRNYFPDFGRGVFTWNTDPLLVENWSRPEAFDLTTGGQPKTGLAYHTRAMIRAPGRYELNPISQLVNLNVGVTGFGFFQQRQYQQFSVQSNRPSLEVRPLPPAPDGFAGAVGDFKLVSRLVPTTAAVGDPVTWTLELSGKGNWPDIHALPAREVSRDFQVIQPQARRVPAEGRIFEATLGEDIVLVPTRPGQYVLEAVRFTYFDPSSGTYKTLEAPAATVVVTGAAGAPGAAQQGPGTSAAASPKTTLAAAAPPTELPRDPLPDSGNAAAAPLGSGGLAAMSAGPFAALGAFWLWLALQRARETDPRRARREARARLAGTLAALRSRAPGPGETGAADPDGRHSSLGVHLLKWQRDSAILWEIPHAAPSARQVASASARRPAGAAGGAPEAGNPWEALWLEADLALYGADRALPGDWVARAEAALAAVPPPRFARWRLFLPRNLLPFLFAAALLLGAASSPAIAEDAPVPARGESVSGDLSYRRGDFSAAEAAWRRELQSSPADSAAHYNLSLALAQQSRWDEAAAHASVAFVQDPGDAAVRWQFSLACDKAGVAPSPLVGFVAPGPQQRLARLASPAAWQWVMGIAAALVAVSLGFGLDRGFHSRPGVRPALVAACLAAVLFFAASAGRQAYGMAGDPRAAIVWRAGILRSIPTEADVGQKTAPLAAGSVALVNKGFLGWVRLSFENGETGWVRAEEIVPFWSKPAALK
jgi:tetratricopeptide (TPR) repeat protein